MGQAFLVGVFPSKDDALSQVFRKQVDGAGGLHASLVARVNGRQDHETKITKLKAIKRQMYGRAKFDLLRQRALYAA